MPDTIVTTYLNITLPVNLVRATPLWGNDLEQAFIKLDQLLGTGGSGIVIQTSNLNINADLSLNSLNLTTARSVRVNANASPLAVGTDINCFYAAGVGAASNAYFNDGAGRQVQLTAGGALNVGPTTNWSTKTNVTGSYTILSVDTYAWYQVNVSGGVSTVSLPIANSVALGRWYIIQDYKLNSETNNIIITPNGTDNINGVNASYILAHNGASVVLASDGNSNWYLTTSGENYLRAASIQPPGTAATAFTVSGMAGTTTGGNLALTSGTGTTAGNVLLKTGGTTRLTVSPTNVTIAAFGTAGIVHNDSSGNLTSSTIVNADISGSAAIAYSKLALTGSIVNADIASAAAIAASKIASGSAGQILVSNTPTSTWTTMGGDVSITNVGTTAVNAISGSSPIAISAVNLQWAAGVSGPTISQVAAASPTTMNIVAQGATGSNQGALLYISSGSSASGAPGYLNLQVGGTTMIYADATTVNLGAGAGNTTTNLQVAGTTNLTVTSAEFKWATGIASPAMGQASTSGGSGTNFTISAQGATGASNNGGNLVLTGGTSGSATAGAVNVQAAGTTVLSTGPNANGTASVFMTGGTLQMQQRAIAANYTVDATGPDQILLVSTASARTITLPAPTTGRVIVIKDSTGNAVANNITVARHASETIDANGNSYIFSTPFGSLRLISDGTNWFTW